MRHKDKKNLWLNFGYNGVLVSEDWLLATLLGVDALTMIIISN
jgi:hypothetical protein